METRIIDGRKCLVIPMEDNVAVNGIRVTMQTLTDTREEDM